MRLATLSILCAISGCASVHTTVEDTRSVEEFRDSYLRSFNRCDVEGMVSHYASEFRFISRSTPKPITTTEQLRQYYQRACALVPPLTATLLQHRVFAGGATAALDGEFALQQPTAASPQVTLQGTLVLRKIGESWRIVVFHSSEVRSPPGR